MRKLFICIGFVALLISPTYADTVTSGTLTRTTVDYDSRFVVETWVCTADSGGNVTATLTGIWGTIKRVSVDPASGGDQPTDQFDGTITDDVDVDVLASRGSNMSNASTTNVAPMVQQIIANGTDDDKITFAPMVTWGDLDLALTNMGDSNVCTIRIFIDPEF